MLNRTPCGFEGRANDAGKRRTFNRQGFCPTAYNEVLVRHNCKGMGFLARNDSLQFFTA